MKNIDYTRWLQALIPVMQPIIIFGAWLAFSKFDKRADVVSKLIALVEPIPTVDLNVPAPVALASIYHAIDETLDGLSLLEFITEEKVEDLKEEVEELVIVKETAEFRKALADCIANAKKLGPVVYNPIMAPFWVVSCMTQKGFTVSTKYIKDLLF